MKIISGSVELKPEKLITTIYGDAGIGKTSAAFTTDNPLMLDFDQGAYRSAFRKDIAQVDAWEDVAGISAKDLESYDTVIVDTVGRALDMLSASLINSNPKMANVQGALTMQGYGALKSSFVNWLKRIRSFDCDLVLLAHAREDKKQDDTLFYRPDITGGSASEIYKVSDILAYYHVKGGRRTMELAPSDAWAGKDPGGLVSIQVPEFTEAPDFLATVIESSKEKLGGLSSESKLIAEKVQDVAGRINESEDPAELTGIANEMKEAEAPVQRQIRGVLQARVKELGFVYDKELAAYIVPPVEEVGESKEDAA